MVLFIPSGFLRWDQIPTVVRLSVAPFQTCNVGKRGCPFSLLPCLICVLESNTRTLKKIDPYTVSMHDWWWRSATKQLVTSAHNGIFVGHTRYTSKSNILHILLKDAQQPSTPAFIFALGLKNK